MCVKSFGTCDATYDLILADSQRQLVNMPAIQNIGPRNKSVAQTLLVKKLRWKAIGAVLTLCSAMCFHKCALHLPSQQKGLD